MTTTRKELKDNAKATLRGNWTWAVIIVLINELVVWILSAAGHKVDGMYIDYSGNNVFFQLISPLGGILGWVADFIAISVGLSFLHLIDNEDTTEEKPYTAAFSVFTGNRFGPECINFVMTSIFTFLWTLLLIIPGIVKSYSYSMTSYIVNDMVASGKSVGATDGINASKELMNGHKMDLFIFDLSFIGWFILGSIPAGIGLLWVIPYYQTAKANFYRKLAGDRFLK
ncbi:DUF975 family protein [uncultured Lactobacillus sp.]|uniref:DUF975 family protein n=1 Tax=uncultured Lactobacillus sp. TaxID=153152 RepID=UPI002805602B|nr:DUF975 family protein [uncultured Lactobacillus sp.]